MALFTRFQQPVPPPRVGQIRAAVGHRTRTQSFTPGVAVNFPSPPLISNFVPTPGTNLGVNSSISFTVTSTGSFRRIAIEASFNNRALVELVHDGDSFAPNYISSTRTPIAGGYQYTIVHSNGWPAAPTIATFAIDTLGQEGN